MKTFEITTPALKETVTALQGVISGRQDGSIEKDEARDIIGAGNGVIRAVGQELKVRLAMPKLAAMEAKMIEAEAGAKQIAA